MSMAPSPTQPPSPPPPASHAGPVPWPRLAQWTLPFLLGATAVLLAVHVFGNLRGGSWPSAVQAEGAAPGSRIDLNHSSHGQGPQLPGEGEKLAKPTEDSGVQHGDLHSVAGSTPVNGIGADRQKQVELRKWARAFADADAERDPGPLSWLDELSRTDASSPSSGSGTPSPSNPGIKKDSKPIAQIDINQASAEELKSVSGIGPTISQRILEERSKAPFKSVDDLRRVSGVGMKTLEKLRPFLTVGESPGKVAPAAKPDDR
jgi:competence protein ComEA